MSALMVLLFGQLMAQDAVTAKDTAWKKGGSAELLFNQAAYSDWQAGGANSFAANGAIFLFAKYDDGGDWAWTNALNLAYGVNLQDGLYNKTDDRIEFESRADRHISEHWSISGLLNFRSQFTNGYSTPGITEDSLKLSSFMAPGYVIVGLGFTYQPNKRFSAFLSPLTSKQTYVLDQMLADNGAFGVDIGSQFRQEIGAYVNLKYYQGIVENVELKASLDPMKNGLQNWIMKKSKNYLHIEKNWLFQQNN